MPKPDKKHNQIGEQLLSIIERVERLTEEKKAIQDDVKEVFGEAKSNGYDIKAIRAIIKLRGMDKADRDEQETMLEIYKDALGMQKDLFNDPP